MYIFDATLPSGGFVLKALVLFSGQVEGADSDYGAILERLLAQVRVSPEAVIFIYPEFLDQHISELLTNEGRLLRGLQRFGEGARLLVFSFDEYGVLTEKLRENAGEGFSYDLQSWGKAIVNQGLLNLASARRDALILKSPPGTAFLKPSKKKYDEFIKASELAVGHSENQFVGFALLTRRPRLDTLTDIWIDTSGISAFVEGVIYYLSGFSSGPVRLVKYHSFGSYEGVEKHRPDDPRSVWVIISASASNNLGMHVAQTWGVDHGQVVTILSFKKSEDGQVGDQILLDISSLSKSRIGSDPFSSAIPVKVCGENFTAQICEPAKSALKSAYKPDSIERSITPFHSVNVYSCNRSLPKSTSVKSICVDFSNALISDSNKKIEIWLKQIVSWYVPHSLTHIIYDTSDKHAQELFSALSKYLPNSNFSTVAANEVDKSRIGDGSALILAPVISSGRSLLQINRDLRMSGHTGNRIFVCPFVVAKSAQDYDVLKKSLLYAPSDMKYLFFAFHTLFIGNDGVANSWERERRLVENFNSPLWVSRARVLSQFSNGINGAIGVTSHTGQSLELTPDFAFWVEEYDCTKVNLEAIYATVACLLQGMRERPEGSVDSLCSDIYRQVVIDPENFSRFNDSILQSSLWRAATEMEVDYTGSISLSEQFASTLEKLIKAYSDGRNNAALDLLVGLAIRKIKLDDGALGRVVDCAATLLVNDIDAMQLVEYLQQ